MPDYELKAYIHNNMSIALEIVKGVRKYGYYFDNANPYDDGKWERAIAKYSPYVELFEELNNHIASDLIIDECDRIINADKQRRKRLRKRINEMFMNGSCYFVTLTFNDEVLNNTTSKDRRVMVIRFLKTVGVQYVGNIDFGKTTAREHFHAIVRSDILNDIQYHYHNRYGWVCDECEQFSHWSKNGFYTIKSCNKDENDIKKLASYVTKLTNHAIKETTKRNALIYSR